MSNQIYRKENAIPLVAADSPKVIPNMGYAGLSIALGSGATLTSVKVGGEQTGAFTDTVIMEGTGNLRWPDSDGANAIYHAPFVEIAFSGGPITVYQKG